MHDVIHIPKSYLGFLFWHLWMTHPPRACAWTPALILHLTNLCTELKVLSLTKPKGKIYKTKSLGHYITISISRYFFEYTIQNTSLIYITAEDNSKVLTKYIQSTSVYMLYSNKNSYRPSGWCNLIFCEYMFFFVLFFFFVVVFLFLFSFFVFNFKWWFWCFCLGRRENPNLKFMIISIISSI